MSDKGLVLVTRPLKRASETAEKIKRLNFDVLIEPMLSVQDVPFNVPDFDAFQGVVFTSVQGVEPFSQKVFFRDIAVYAVGARTGEALRQCGFLNVIVGDGDVNALGRTLLEYAKGDKPFLHVCGRNVAGDLSADGYGLEKLVVYHAVQAKSFSVDCINALREGRINFVSFYSKRTAAAFVRLLEATGGDVNLEAGLRDIKVLCISESVLECVWPELWSGVYVASQPDEAGMLALLEQHA